MRGSWLHLSIIFALIAMSICSACVSQPEENKSPVQNISPPVNMGLSQIPESPVPTSVSLEKARQMVGEMDIAGSTGNNSQQDIYYVVGRNLDATGSAESWLFGTRSPEGNTLLVYERNRWTVIPWTATLPSEEIPFEKILLPDELISQNRNEISGTTGASGIREIELKNGIYSLTLTGGSTDLILAFNATTGVLIA